LALGVAVGGSGLGGSAVAGGIAVSVGSKGEGVCEGAGCVSFGTRVSFGAGGLGLSNAEPGFGATPVGEGIEGSVGVALGWAEGVGIGVFVGTLGTIRLFVGAGATAGAPGLH
jgi:hypothetical protein